MSYTFESMPNQEYSDSRMLRTMYNATGITLQPGAVVAYVAGAQGTPDCWSVTIPTTGQLDLVCGIVADKTQTKAGVTGIASGAVGYVIVEGLATSAYYNVASSASGAIGDRLVPVAGSTNLAYQTTGDGSSGHFANMVTIASSTASQTGVATEVFVRCL